MIPSELTASIEKALSNHAGKTVAITGTRSVSGGCINECFKMDTSAGPWFLKYNLAGRFPGMFEAEKHGLSLLRLANACPVPEVIATGNSGPYSFLLLSWIEAGKRRKNFWTDFGTSLANLHRNTNVTYGLEVDNYIGSLPQSNRKHGNWIEFFIHERLQPQLKLGVDDGKISTSLISKFESLYAALHEFIPEEQPALLHGDLWSGNFLVNEEGRAALVDPAVYFGHREMDLAMTRLFGGFDSDFYAAYQESYPLQKGFDSRIDLHNLYPLLVHVNLFGGGYLQQALQILKRYV